MSSLCPEGAIEADLASQDDVYRWRKGLHVRSSFHSSNFKDLLLIQRIQVCGDGAQYVRFSVYCDKDEVNTLL